ncbi:MAG: hypothetical protein K5637_06115 [Lachnospiraceae bacterium]|nr:hypothetical protein [Lachnospiraceae bacterium]
MDKLREISIEIPGYLYTSQKIENDESGCITYQPKKTVLVPWLYFSNVSIVTVKEVIEASKIVFMISGKPTKGMRYYFNLLCSVAVIMQIFIIIMFILSITNIQIANPFENPIDLLMVIIIPTFFLAGLLFTERIVVSNAIRDFAEEYKKKIEEIISAEYNEVS